MNDFDDQAAHICGTITRFRKNLPSLGNGVKSQQLGRREAHLEGVGRRVAAELQLDLDAAGQLERARPWFDRLSPMAREI